MDSAEGNSSGGGLNRSVFMKVLALRKDLVGQRKQPEEEEVEWLAGEPHVKTDPDGFSNRLATLTLKNYLSINKINTAVREGFHFILKDLVN